jgi:hypothetical protein
MGDTFVAGSDVQRRLEILAESANGVSICKPSSSPFNVCSTDNISRDKHDRPYKCPAEGCEKLPGFTYSGGLLRHEREVHNKHGGPRKQLNCPHPNCKRHTGKGFSRQENLNEHLRRVHTDAGAQDGEATEEEEEAKPGQKRKRAAAANGRDDVREELKRLRAENEDLKRNLDVQTSQTNKMMQQIAQVRSHK